MTLHLYGVSKTYGRQIALDDITCTLEDGPVALLGANGSGKTTLLRLLATLDQPGGGMICWNGLVYSRDLAQLRARIGYLPQTLDLPDHLTPRRLLHYLALMRHSLTETADELMRQMGLATVADKRLSSLSGGQLRQVGIAQALLGDPPLLLLDELGAGLDATERERAVRLITRHNGLTLFSTHIPTEAEHFAQNVIVLAAGRLCFAGTVASMCQTAQGQVYEMEIMPDDLSQLAARWKISRILSRDERLIVRVVGERPEADAVTVTPTLEDAYLNLVSPGSPRFPTPMT